MFPGGQNLRMLREQLGSTMRDVEQPVRESRRNARMTNFRFPRAGFRMLSNKRCNPQYLPFVFAGGDLPQGHPGTFVLVRSRFEWNGSGPGLRYPTEITRFRGIGKPLQHSNADSP